MEYQLSGKVNNELLRKYQALMESLRSCGRLAVAFSGGVDSTFLLMAAKEALGENILAISMRIHSMPEREAGEIERFCQTHEIISAVIDYNELEIPGFTDNPPDRCYICKKALFSEIIKRASEEGFDIVAEGSNADDTKDYRPGMKALSELGIRSPLKEAGLSKEEIRLLSKEMNLPTYKKPSAACLSSRFPYGDRITEEKLRMVDKAETYLASLDLGQLRVRMHGNDLARIEVLPAFFPVVMENRPVIEEKLREIGFRYVTLDLKGFRSGSLNEALPK